MIAISFEDAFTSDSLVTVFREADKYKVFLTLFLENVLGQLNLLVDGEAMAQVPEALKVILTRVKNILHAFACLCFPVTGYLKSEIQHVTSLKTYKGKEMLEQTMSKIMSQTFWMNQRDELLRKAGSHKLIQPKFEEILAHLDTTADAYSKNVALRKAVEELPSLRKSLREGATASIEVAMLEILKAEVPEILKTNGSDIVPSWLEAVLLACKLLGRSEDFSKLQDWKTKVAKNLAWRAIEEEATAISLRSTDSDFVAKLDLKTFAEAMSKCPDATILPSSTLQALQMAAPTLMRTLKLRASWI